ncbi:uncharacterized protein BDW47DRAFT_79973 [Aspergillus candidus]|uniref:Uncharacterized protein n=1 Tax=Aspergillus candidus TaxID=41067 RepID=A0A2I2F0U9_ASPCN|nr:hypothetical protein BDW47DRAFT_79973 [Aspergillus candidus]PLB34262.1 hypothetical protein BDW47DRAFT_79973 [Aspergillus candidus]
MRDQDCTIELHALDGHQGNIVERGATASSQMGSILTAENIYSLYYSWPTAERVKTRVHSKLWRRSTPTQGSSLAGSRPQRTAPRPRSILARRNRHRRVTSGDGMIRCLKAVPTCWTAPGFRPETDGPWTRRLERASGEPSDATIGVERRASPGIVARATGCHSIRKQGKEAK